MQAPGRALRTCMNAAESGDMTGPMQVVQCRLVSRPTLFATCNKNKSCPCLASNDKPTGTPSAAAIGSDTCVVGRCLQCSLDPMCEDNNRFHSNCVWVDHPCEERGRVLLGCTVDRPLRETRANFENIVRVVALPPRCVGGRVRLPVENWQLFRAQIPVWR